MLTIDDPELERFIRDEAARTGEEPAAVLRRYLPAPLTPIAATGGTVPVEEQARRTSVIREIQQELTALPRLDERTPDEILGYDEHGLPT
jgi:antitoxin VapB